MHPLLLTLCAALLSGCVSTSAHYSRLEELQRLRRDSVDREKALLGRIGSLEKLADDQAFRLKAEEQGRARLASQLDDSTALVGELQARLQRAGQSVDELGAEPGPLGESLKEAKERLEELRRQKAAAEASARTYRGLVERLRGPIDAGQLQVVARDGRLLIAMPDDVLFDSGKAQIKPDGQAALARVADALKAIPERRFLVTGHSDDLPIRTGRYPSNWELSAGRALDVTRLLIQDGVRPQALAAAGFAQFDPLYPNDSPEHRALNRRIEIVLLPTPADLPPLEIFGAAQ